MFPKSDPSITVSRHIDNSLTENETGCVLLPGSFLSTSQLPATNKER